MDWVAATTVFCVRVVVYFSDTGWISEIGICKNSVNRCIRVFNQASDWSIIIFCSVTQARLARSP